MASPRCSICTNRTGRPTQYRGKLLCEGCSCEYSKILDGTSIAKRNFVSNDYTEELKQLSVFDAKDPEAAGKEIFGALKDIIEYEQIVRKINENMEE